MGRLLQTEGLTEIQRDILDAVRDFVDAEILPVASELEHNDEYPKDILRWRSLQLIKVINGNLL